MLRIITRLSLVTLLGVLGSFGTSFANSNQESYALVDTIFRDADELFAQRENNRAKIAQARSAYNALLSRVSGDQLAYAVAQLGRLAIYEGEMLLPKTATTERKAIFQDCWCKTPRINIIRQGSCDNPGFVDKIKNVNGREHPAYYYFQSVCMAYWLEVSGPIEKVAFVSQLDALLTRGPSVNYDLVKGSEFEGGGITRVSAGVHSNPASAALGFHKPEEAMIEIDKSLSAPAAIGDPNSGARYFGNHQIKAGVYIQLDNKFPSAGWMQKGIDYTNATLIEMTDIIDFDTYPTERKPEFMYNYSMIKKLYKDMTGDEWVP
jgi:hypothetical protein